jgi:outer membrane protein assembly factor BamB
MGVNMIRNPGVFYLARRCSTVTALVFLASLLIAGDAPQWGHGQSRNMVSLETGLPSSFDPATGINIKWTAKLGTQCWASPTIAQGKIFIGTNNERPRNLGNPGDRGVLFCLDEKTGRFIWQILSAKLEGDKYKDWPRVGIVSPATVENDRVYILSNRLELMCLDINGMDNGNDGPFREEGKHMVQSADAPLKPGKTDADIIWLNDLQKTAGVYPHDSVHGSVVVDGDYLYVNSANGVDKTHANVPCPDAPSLLVFDKKTGRLVGMDEEFMGRRMFHATWAAPSIGVIGGRKLVFFGGGDGVCYAFEPAVSLKNEEVQTLKNVWRFDCDPTGPKEDLFRFSRNRKEGPSIIKSMPVYHDGRVYVSAGGDIWWGKQKSWLKCIDASGSGDITSKGEIWSFAMDTHCCSTPSIHDGLVYIADCGKNVHCLDAATGLRYWSHEAEGAIWGSTMVADGKVYFGTRRGDFWILAAGKEKQVLCSVKLDGSMSSTPAVANGVVYVSTMETLYAIAEGGQGVEQQNGK